MYHDNLDKEDSLPYLIQKKTPVTQQHHKVFLIFLQVLHPIIKNVQHMVNNTTQPEVNDWVQ